MTDEQFERLLAVLEKISDKIEGIYVPDISDKLNAIAVELELNRP